MRSRLFILGPTASGKHAAALAVASELGAAIISIDSMKVYRRMDIGTAKPTREELSRVEHFLIDILDPSESYSAARFVDDAKNGENRIVASGRPVCYAGGTALYYKALSRGIFRGPSADGEIRKELAAIADKRGALFLHAELEKVDPNAARKIHTNDLRRIVRALEVFRKTGQKISDLQTQFDAEPTDGAVVCLRRERDDLRRRIEHRVREMFGAGLIDEVRGLLKEGDGWSREARSGVGYKEVVEHLSGECDREELERRICVNTWRFARRQMMWFKSFKEVAWIDVADSETPKVVARRILAVYNRAE